MATTKLSTDVIDLSGNTEALTIPKGTTDSTLEVEYLVVAGGGAGGASGFGGGGGAGGLKTNFGGTAVSLIASTNYSVTIGAGGSGGGTSTPAPNGNSSDFNGIVAIGGGGGGNHLSNGGNGASGGGGGGDATSSGGTGSDGNNGGLGYDPAPESGGGGGGFGAVGQNGNATQGGDGGAGVQNNIDGNNSFYAAGGGGCIGRGDLISGASPAAGGSSIGGNGGINKYFGGGGSTGASPTVGTANTGSGGGGGSSNSSTGGSAGGANGGSGIVILRYPTANPITLSSGLYGNLAYATTGVCNYPTTAVALYQFESNGNDTCGNWNSTSEPGITYFTPGKFGYAANFTQTTSGVYLPKITTITNDVSVSGWLRLGSTTTSNGLRFIEINATTVGYAGVLAVFYTPSNGEWKVRVGDGSSSETDVLIHTYTLTQAVWYNVCVTRDDSSNVTKLYINGSEVDSETISATPTVQASAISVIGQYVGSSTGYGWLGDMDQVRLFSSVLTSDQVQALYYETTEATTGTSGTETWSKFIAGTGTVSFAGTGTGRPSSPTEGLMRENTTTGKMEFYDGSVWQEITDTASTYASALIPSVNFNTVIYSNPGLSTPISVGFGPDMVLFKERNGVNVWQLYDTVRGDDYALYTDLTDAQYNYSTHPNGDLSPTITSTGFTTPPVTNNGINNSSNFVSYSWKGGGAAVTNSVGTNANSSEVSANVAAGFSIVKVQADGTNNTIGHGLGGIPELIFSKNTGVSGAWGVYSAPTGIGHYMYLNQSSAVNPTFDGSVYPSVSSTTFAPGSGGWNFTNGNNYIHYLWRSIPGYSKIGFYVGNGSTTGPEIYTGFKPAWLMTKPTTSGYWYILDNKRNTSNPRNTGLFPNDSLAEITSTNYNVDFNNTGFQPKNNTIGFNNLGITYIYMTFAE